MALDYEFAPIGVDIITHPKLADVAKADRLAAFGLWTWGQCYARLHSTGGTLKRSAVLSALAAPEAAILRLASALVSAGLWTELDELGGWAIHNFERKTSGKSSTERVKRWREKKRKEQETAGGSSETEPVTALHETLQETRFRERSPSPSISPSVSVSSGGGAGGTMPGAGGPPDWFRAQVESVELTTGERLDLAVEWVGYQAHCEDRASAPSAPGSRVWLARSARMAKTSRMRSGANGTAKQPRGSVTWVSDHSGFDEVKP